MLILKTVVVVFVVVVAVVSTVVVSTVVVVRCLFSDPSFLHLSPTTTAGHDDSVSATDSAATAGAQRSRGNDLGGQSRHLP